jgi:NTP pyrophosphatase (non-canonical NTP hydrolase)
MNFKEYQEKAKTTAVYPIPNLKERYTRIYSEDDVLDLEAARIIPIMYCALGLVGETGEVIEQVKKSWRNDMKVTDDRKEKIREELGDVLWYASQLATELSLDLEDIAVGNIVKLQNRKNFGELKHE